jgi:hypothetical protein
MWALSARFSAGVPFHHSSRLSTRKSLVLKALATGRCTVNFRLACVTPSGVLE